MPVEGMLKPWEAAHSHDIKKSEEMPSEIIIKHIFRDCFGTTIVCGRFHNKSVKFQHVVWRWSV